MAIASDEGEDRASMRFRFARIAIGLPIPLPFLYFALLGAAVNNTYFRDTFDPVSYWLTKMIFIFPPLLAAAFVMVFRFRSVKAGRVACFIGLLLWVGMALFIWWRL